MNTFELLQQLSEKSIRIKLEDGSLAISAPKGAMTKELQVLLKDNKEALVSWLEKNRKVEGKADDLLLQIEHDAHALYEPFPLSDLQVAFYMANDPFMEFQVRPHYYMESDYVGLDTERYQAAWNKALLRHRKELVLINGEEQLELIKELPELNIPILDLSDNHVNDCEQQLLSIRQSMMRSQLPIGYWPWFDIRISKWNNNGVITFRVHYNNNNFYSDGLGTTGLLKEVWEYYNNPSATRPPIEIGFRDTVVALEALEKSELGVRAERYWMAKIPELPAAPEIPLIQGKNRRVPAHMNRREFFLDKIQWQQFKDHAGKFGLTSSNAILTLQAKILSAFSGNSHFIISHMMTRRLPIHSQIKEVLGNFASLYPLEVDFRVPATFADDAKKIQQRVMDDAAHTHWGGMKVMRELNKLSGEMGASPSPYVVGSGIFMGAYEKPDFSCLETSQTLLDHQFWELTDGRFYGVWDLLEEFFPEGLINSMWSAYQSLFTLLASDCDAWQQVEFNLTPQQDLVARNRLNDNREVFKEGLLHSALKTQSGCRDAVISRGIALSYDQLNDLSHRLATQLLHCNVQSGHRIAIVMDRNNDLMVTLAGVLKAGAAYVPVNPELPAQRMQFLIENSGASIVITESKYMEDVSRNKLANTIINIHDVGTWSVKHDELQDPSDDSLAYIIYTSGSTGTPKGVAIDHRGALNTIQDINRKFNVTSSDIIMAVSAYSFDLSVYDVFGAWDAGASVIYPDVESAFNPSHWLELMKNHKVTVWNSAPPLMSLLAEAALRQGAILENLRLVMLSGDWIPLQLPEQIKQFAPNAKVISLGGATEASIWSIYYPVEQVKADWLSIPYGWPMANQTWRILDRSGNPVPTYTSGELYIGGKGLAICYWNDHVKTEKSFFINPKTGERLYRTGDQGRYLPDGTIEFLGRLDSQVKIQGHRIELGEIESALRDCAAVYDCIVQAQEGKDRHDKRLVAHVILTNTMVDTDEVVIATLQEVLRERLPVYMVPKSWNLLDKFPVTANGKIDRKALANMRTADNTARTSISAVREAPKTEMEMLVFSAWQDVLGNSNFGRDDDFFEIGGQSFDAVRVAGLIQEKQGVSISLGDIWRHRTIKKIAEFCLNDHSGKSDSLLIPLSDRSSGTPLFMVHPAGGYCIRYKELAEMLPYSLYGIQASGLDCRSSILTSIESMAAKYIADIKARQPQGPYKIGGWSSGGLIAFEIVQRLRTGGDDVEQLLIVDCPSPHEHDEVTNIEMLNWFLEDMAMDLPLHILANKIDQKSTPQQQLEQAVGILNNLDYKLDAKSLAPIYEVFSTIVVSGRNYYPNVIDIDIHLVRAQDGEVSEFSHHPYGSESGWGWKRLTSGRVQVKAVKGTHHTVLAKDNVCAIADFILAREYDCEVG